MNTNPKLNAETRRTRRQMNLSPDLTMISRWHPNRWSKTRKRMVALRAGKSMVLPRAEYFNAHSSTLRLNDAYDGLRRYRMVLSKKRVTVTREF